MLTPDSFLWKALEFYGTKVHHRGKWRIHEKLRSILRIEYSGNIKVSRKGLEWILNPSDFVQSTFYWIGEFEFWDWFHLTRLVPTEGVAFDIGANFGFYSLMLAQKLHAKVFAFEPCADTFSRLKKNIDINRLGASITPVPLALSDVHQSGFLSTVAGNSGSNFLSDQGNRVTLDTLDSYCAHNGIPAIDFIKIDVEGHELHVLNGSRQMLGKCKPAIMIEFNSTALQRSGSSPKEVEACLCSMGYELFVPRRERLTPWKQYHNKSDIFNVFALYRAASTQ